MNKKLNHISEINEIITDDSGDEAITKELQANLKAYNEEFIGPYHREQFNIYAKSKENKIIAGISGNTLLDLCYVTTFWVDNAYRGRGLGRMLQLGLEKHAIKKGCKSIQLDTAQFQAKNFYLKVGYEIVATIPKVLMGYDQYIMRKIL